MWLSKNVCYEIPYNVKGIVKYTGSKETSKDICKDRKIGTKLCHPKPYQLLLDAINAPKEQQAQKLFMFVDNWYKQLSDTKRPYIPKGGCKYHGIPDVGTDSYLGYWCVEAVAAVKAANPYPPEPPTK